MANLLAYGTQIVGGGNSPSTGGGHVIENASGTDLAQRDTLQFVGGLKTTDDSTNGKTVVDDSPIEMTWTQWNTLTPAEQQALPKVLITDAPGVDGPINVDLIKTLWTNPNPTSAFAAQNINLLNDDYDLLIFVGYYSTSYTAWLISSTCNKGHGTILHFSYNGTDFLRTVTRVSDSSFNIADGQKGYGQTVEIDNTVCVPIAIYGIKQSVTVDVSGVISDVSTDADKCMIDTNTSVEDMLTPVSLTSQYTQPGLVSCFKYGKLIFVVIEYTPSSLSHGDEILAQLPKTSVPCYMTLGMANGQCVPCLLQNVSGQDYAQLIVYYPTATLTASRIDATFTYIAL